MSALNAIHHRLKRQMPERPEASILLQLRPRRGRRRQAAQESRQLPRRGEGRVSFFAHRFDDADLAVAQRAASRVRERPRTMAATPAAMPAILRHRFAEVLQDVSRLAALMACEAEHRLETLNIATLALG